VLSEFNNEDIKDELILQKLEEHVVTPPQSYRQKRKISRETGDRD